MKGYIPPRSAARWGLFMRNLSGSQAAIKGYVPAGSLSESPSAVQMGTHPHAKLKSWPKFSQFKGISRLPPSPPGLVDLIGSSWTLGLAVTCISPTPQSTTSYISARLVLFPQLTLYTQCRVCKLTPFRRLKHLKRTAQSSTEPLLRADHQVISSSSSLVRRNHAFTCAQRRISPDETAISLQTRHHLMSNAIFLALDDLQRTECGDGPSRLIAGPD